MKATRPEIETYISANYDRFLAGVDSTTAPDSCHPWTRHHRHGYGGFGAGGKNYVAHRWLLGYLRGNPLSGAELGLHHCDNPSCCNPRHLYIGTQFDNMRDAVDRGRLLIVGVSQTHCLRGHEYTLENTYRSPSTGHRSCRQCKIEWQRAWRSLGNR